MVSTSARSDLELVVGAASNIGTYLLQPLVKSIGEAHAGRYRIRQVLGTNADILDRLTLGEVDFALTEWWDQATWIRGHPLAR